MRAISDAFRQRLRENTTLLAKATLTLASGKVVELSGDDLVAMSCEQATSASDEFEVGAAVIGKLSVTLNNHDGRFDAYDFTGSQVVAYVGARTSITTTEWLRLGTYLIDQPDSYAGTIELSALDFLSKLERPYSEVTTAYPATLRTIVSDVAAKCGLYTVTGTFANNGYRVAVRPDDDNLTCLDVVSYAAQASGNFAKVDERGRLYLGWYDTSAFEGEAWLDGGEFDASKPYSTGDAADGGTFDNYGAGAAKDGGTFDSTRSWAHIQAAGSLTVTTDDVVVTGVEVTAQNEVKEDGSNGEDGETRLFGSKGYVLSLGSNPLVLYGQASAVAAMVGARVVGMRFRPFSASIACDPSIEAGDGAVVTDAKGNSHRSYVTSAKLVVNGSMSVECGARSASRNSADAASAATKAIVAARNDLKREQTARERALEELNQQLKDSSGLFSTKVRQSDGSYVYYLHDKAELGKSKIVWKMTAEAVGVSTDGGKTYSTALNADGDAILNRIYAIGLDADYITTGRLSSRDGKNYIDLVTGEMAISASTSVGGKTVQQYADAALNSAKSDATTKANNALSAAKTYADTASKNAVNAQTQTSIFNKLTNNGQTQGIYLSEGKLYINGSYLKSGTISGDYIKGGTIEGSTLKSSASYDSGTYTMEIENTTINYYKESEIIARLTVNEAQYEMSSVRRGKDVSTIELNRLGVSMYAYTDRGASGFTFRCSDMTKSGYYSIFDFGKTGFTLNYGYPGVKSVKYLSYDLSNAAFHINTFGIAETDSRYTNFYILGGDKTSGFYFKGDDIRLSTVSGAQISAGSNGNVYISSRSGGTVYINGKAVG